VAALHEDHIATGIHAIGTFRDGVQVEDRIGTPELLPATGEGGYPLEVRKPGWRVFPQGVINSLEISPAAVHGREVNHDHRLLQILPAVAVEIVQLDAAVQLREDICKTLLIQARGELRDGL